IEPEDAQRLVAPEDGVDHLLQEEGERHIDEGQRDADQERRAEQDPVRASVRQQAPDLGPGSPFFPRRREAGRSQVHTPLPQATDAGARTSLRAPDRIMSPLRQGTPVACRTSSIPRRLFATMPPMAPTV